VLVSAKTSIGIGISSVDKKRGETLSEGLSTMATKRWHR
jgi:hypothetical protein